MKCKICEASQDRKQDIERRLKTGRPCREISKDLKAVEFNVTATQLVTHLDHMESLNSNEKTKMVQRIDDTIQVAKRLKEIEKDLRLEDYTSTAIDVRLKMTKLLEAIAQKQMVIVDHHLDRFCDGLCPYPKDQIRGMQVVLNLLDAQPTYSDKTQGYEIDQISERARTLKALPNPN